MTYRRIYPPQSIEEYGMNAGRFIEQAGSPSGFLLDWMAIDEHAAAVVERRASRYLVVGENIRSDSVRFPELMRVPA